jgi:Tol biopolymer transport system component
MRRGGLEPFVKAVAGGEAEPVLSEEVRPDSESPIDSVWPLDWTPDGRQLVCCSRDERGDVDLWLLPIEGTGQAVPLRRSPFREEDAALSPDGRWLAYTSDRSGRSEVYVTDFPHGRRDWQVSENGGLRPEWNPEGGEVFFLSPEDVLTAAEVTPHGEDLELGEIRPLFPLDLRPHLMAEPGGYAVAPDGRRFLVNRLVDSGTTSPIRVIVGWPEELAAER